MKEEEEERDPPKVTPADGVGSWGGHNGASSVIRKLRSVKKGRAVGVGKGLVGSLWRSPNMGKNGRTAIFHKKGYTVIR